MERIAVWMNSTHRYFRPEIEGKVSLKNTITQEAAQQIVKDNPLINEIYVIQLNYYANPNPPLEEVLIRVFGVEMVRL